MADNGDEKTLSKVEKMEALRKQLNELEGEQPHQSSSEDEIERGTVPARRSKNNVDASACGALPAKRPRTPKQIEAFKKAQQRKAEVAEQRRLLREKAEIQAKAEAEKELIEKAIKVKKKQIKKMAMLQEFSDDDTPIERGAPRTRQPPQPIETKIRFI